MSCHGGETGVRGEAIGTRRGDQRVICIKSTSPEWVLASTRFSRFRSRSRSRFGPFLRVCRAISHCIPVRLREWCSNLKGHYKMIERIIAAQDRRAQDPTSSRLWTLQHIHCARVHIKIIIIRYYFGHLPQADIYKVYLNPSRPSIILPPFAARLLALQNFKFSKSAMMTIMAAAIMHAMMPGT